MQHGRDTGRYSDLCPSLTPEDEEIIETPTYQALRWQKQGLVGPIFPNDVQPLATALAEALEATHLIYHLYVPRTVYDQGWIGGAQTNSAFAIFLYGSTEATHCGQNPAISYFESALAHFAANGVTAVAVVVDNSGTPEARRKTFLTLLPWFVYWLGERNIVVTNDASCFVGHSAGGEGAILAASDLVDDPLRCVVALAPSHPGTVSLPSSTSFLLLTGTHDDDLTVTASRGQIVYDLVATQALKAKFILRGCQHSPLGPFLAPNLQLLFDTYGNLTKEGSVCSALRDLIALAFFKHVLIGEQNVFTDLLWVPNFIVGGPALAVANKAITDRQFELPSQRRGRISPGRSLSLFDPSSLPDVTPLPAGFWVNSPCVIGALAGRFDAVFQGPETEEIPRYDAPAVPPSLEHIAARTHAKGVRVFWDRTQPGCPGGDEAAIVRYQLPFSLSSSLPPGELRSSIYLLIDMALIVDADLNLANQVINTGDELVQPVIQDWWPGCLLRASPNAGMPYNEFVQPIRQIQDHSGFAYALYSVFPVQLDQRATFLNTAVYRLTDVLKDANVNAVNYIFLELTGGQPHARGDAFIGAMRLAWGHE